MSTGLSVNQFRRFVVRPTLQSLQLWSPAAEALLLGTAAHESGGLRFIDQVTGEDDVSLGPAIGLYQIEPKTHDDLWTNFLRFRLELTQRIGWLVAAEPDKHTQLATNLAYATAVARLIYYRAPDPLPAADDIPGLAAYWKRLYNTAAGKGSEAQFVVHYQQHVLRS